MEPFRITSSLDSLKETYPPSHYFREAISKGGHRGQSAIARLWLSEGIPFAFKEKPGIYEAVREWIGARLSIEPKEISLSGSARIGYSLSPTKYGKIFSKNSDLDIFAISYDLFERIRKDFVLWSNDYEMGKIKPRTQKENLYWRDNLRNLPKNINRGFIDHKLIPNFNEYKNVQSTSQTMYLLKEKLNVTQNAPRIREASLRVYKDWPSFTNQIVLNLANLSRE